MKLGSGVGGGPLLGLSVGPALALVLCLLGVAGVFDAPDGILYDALMKLRSRARDVESRVLIVELDQHGAANSEERVLDVVNRLRELGARQIVFNFVPPADWLELYSTARESPIVFGRAVYPDAVEPAILVAEDLPEVIARYELEERVGVVRLPPAVGGIHREQWGEASVAGRALPALEWVVARREGRLAESEPESVYRVDFVGGVNSLPTITATRILAGDLVEPLVRGRIALVGATYRQTDARLFTSTTSDSRRMTMLEYQGHALTTLLGDRRLVLISPLSRILLVIVLGMVPFLLVRQATRRVPLVPSLIAAGGEIALVVVAFLGWDLWIPTTEIVLCQGGALLCLLVVRVGESARELRSITSDSRSQLRDKYWPAHLYESSTPWDLVMHMIHQTLDLNRMIVFELGTRRARVRATCSFHCTEDDLAEERRDIQRSPYTDAIAAKEPIRVERFFRRGGAEEEQYICALSFCGQLLGFWAFSVDTAKAASVQRFHRIVVDFGRRLSELLYHIQRRQSDSEDDGRRGSIAHTRGSDFRSLRATLSLLHHRLSVLEAVLNRVTTGIVIYDVFGRVLQVNDFLVATLKKERLSPHEMTALDLVLALSDHDIAGSRRILRHVILDNHSVSFPVTLQSTPDHCWMLHLKPLIADRRESGQAADTIVSKTVLCELVDVTSMTRLTEMRSRLADRLSLRIRDDLSAIEMASSILGTGEVSGRKCQPIADVIHSKVEHSVQALAECKQYLHWDAELADVERFPVDPQRVMANVVESTAEMLLQKGVSLQLRQPYVVSYVLAATDRLEQMLTAVVYTLYADAAEGSQIEAVIGESEHEVELQFRNHGFGIPADVLRGYLFGDAHGSEEFQALRDAARWLESWGGSIDGDSEVGSGIRLTIRLARFI